jgi:hypothetical protein
MATASTPVDLRVLRAAASQMRCLPSYSVSVKLGYVLNCSLLAEFTWSDHCFRLVVVHERSEHHGRTSIFLNSVHLASSALSGLTRLILGA